MCDSRRKRPDQVNDNMSAANAPALTNDVMNCVQSIYDRLIKPEVHDKW